MKPVRRFSVSYFFYRFLKKHINHKYIREDSISYTLFTFITDHFHFLSITKINTSPFGIFRDILTDMTLYQSDPIAIAVKINAIKHAKQNIDQMAERRPSSF